MSTNSRVIALYYSTRDGQARRIAEHICGRLAENGPLAPPQDVAIAKPTPEDLTAASLIVLVAAVRYGKHLPEADQFLTTYRSLVVATAAGAGLGQSHRPQTGKDHCDGQRILAQGHRAPWPRADACSRFRRAARLPALQLAGSPDHPLHHVADRGADRPPYQGRIYVLGCGRRLRRPHRRAAPAKLARKSSASLTRRSSRGPEPFPAPP